MRGATLITKNCKIVLRISATYLHGIINCYLNFNPFRSLLDLTPSDQLAATWSSLDAVLSELKPYVLDEDEVLTLHYHSTTYDTING